MKRVEELAFPVIFIAGDGLLDIRNTTAELTTTGVTALRKGLFKHALVIDRNGSSYRVQGAKRVGFEPPFWGFRLRYSRRVRLELNLESNGDLDLDQIKTHVSSAIRRHPHVWDSIIDKSLNQVLSEISRAPSQQALLDLLAA